MDDVTMNPHPTEPGGFGRDLVRENPKASGEILHLHREAGGHVYCPDTAGFQRAHNGMANFGDVIIRVMKLRVGEGAGRGPDRLAVHPADEADDGAGGRKCRHNVRALFRQRRAIDLDKADIIRPGLETKLAQGFGVDWGRRSRRLARSGAEGGYGRMLGGDSRHKNRLLGKDLQLTSEIILLALLALCK